MAPNRAFIAFNGMAFSKKFMVLSFDVPQAVTSPPEGLDVTAQNWRRWGLYTGNGLPFGNTWIDHLWGVFAPGETG
ncbi:hypothetical protein MMC13_000895 [Lambiella insularis]|nr:hypothetical protein [Lambiella insularis]